jgi:hypothetical protein
VKWIWLALVLRECLSFDVRCGFGRDTATRFAGESSDPGTDKPSLS